MANKDEELFKKPFDVKPKSTQSTDVVNASVNQKKMSEGDTTTEDQEVERKKLT